MKTSLRRSLLLVPCVVTLLAAGRTVAAAAAAPAADAAVPGNYGVAAREVMAHVQRTFWDPRTGVYAKAPDDRSPDYVWRQAAAVSALVAAARHEPAEYGPLLDRVFRSLDTYWDAKAPVPGYEPAPTRGNGNDKYYDDNAWLVITFLEAYEQTGQRAYFDRATETARFVASGWDDQLGGGIWWHELHKDGSKNACASGPAAVGYLRLARHGPPAERATWTRAARDAVAWTRDKLQDNDGLFDDRVIVATGEVIRGKLTYNSALMLRACLGLYRETGEASYLEEAKRIGRAADWFADERTGVYRDPLKWSHFMVETDLDLYRATGEAYLLRRARTNADAYYAAWKKAPPTDMMSNVCTARILWLLADVETERGRAFWRAADERVAAPPQQTGVPQAAPPAARPDGARTAGNPVLPGWYADPEAHVFGERYWIFATYSAPYDEQTFMDCFSSPDLAAWTKHPRIIDTGAIKWAKRAIWAPSVVEKGGRYYLFFAANDIQNDEELGGIGVAVADRPAGPYKDHLGRPLVDRFHNKAQPIDQHVFEDADGQHYLIYGGWRHCNVAKLNDDFTGFVPFEDGTTFKEITPDQYVEGPFMLRRGGRYYLMWSEGGWTGPDYAVAYAVADSPLGPFERVGKVLVQDPAIATGAGHHSVLKAPGTADDDGWYIAYHRRPKGKAGANDRVVCIERMSFDDRGMIRPVTITAEGVEPRPLAQPTPAVAE